ncbi:MAG: FAD binding domain-containing protein [Hyphomicrobiales bacterium]|nr:FAD binding domain-containing protein [Hyphomicrobiales bacterium]
MKAARFDYHRARDVADAVAVLASNAEARVVAGSQSLGPMLNLRLARPPLLVDVSRIAAMRTIARDGDAVRIGAAVTHATIEDGGADEVGGGILAAVALRIGYRSVRNRGTIGGSLAHADPAADWPVALSALDAEVVVAGPTGERTLPIGAFLLGAYATALAPGELIMAVRVRRLSADARWGYCKVARKIGEWADASAAVVVDRPRRHVRVVMGATNGAPVVIDELADALDRPAAERAVMTGVAVARHLSEADLYERQIHAAALRRAIEQACAS